MEKEKFTPCPKSFAAGYEARHKIIIELLENIKAILAPDRYSSTPSYKVLEEIEKYEKRQYPKKN